MGAELPSREPPMRGEARRDPGELPSSPLSLAGEEPSSQPAGRGTGQGGGSEGSGGQGWWVRGQLQGGRGALPPDSPTDMEGGDWPKGRDRDWLCPPLGREAG